MIKLLEHTRRPDISFHRNGIIRITARLARALSLRPGDAINIAVNDGEYLLHATRLPSAIGRHLAQCHPTKKGSANYCAHSVRLCRALLDELGIDAAGASFMVGEPCSRGGVTYVPIITLHPLWPCKANNFKSL